jgi:hypothetical protein
MRKYKYFEATTSDKGIIKPDLIKELVFLRAEELMVGAQAVPVTPMGALELKLQMPKLTRFDPEEIAEGALSAYQMLEWFTTSNTMKKEQTRVLITDEAKARQQEGIQTKTSIELAARGLAWARDSDIFTTLGNGAATSEAATAYWDNTSAADVLDDVAKAIQYILTNSYMTEAEMGNLKVFYPIGLTGFLHKPLGDGYFPGTTIKKYVMDEYHVQFIGTRQLTTTALLVVGSEEVARHIVYNGSDVPSVEYQRLPLQGDVYGIQQYYKTFIMPQAENGTTNTGIYKITGVDA